MSKLEKLTEAIQEANRFIEKAEKWREELIEEQNKSGNTHRWSIYPSINASAAKRASMDLTRSLASLRRRGE